MGKRALARCLPAQRKTQLYSATLDEKAMRLAAQWMPDPVVVEVEPEHVTVRTITQIVYAIAAREKFTVLYNLLKRHDGLWL